MTWAVLALLTASPEGCRTQFESLHFREAAALCRGAVQDAPPEQLGGLYRLLGLSLATMGDEPGALSAFSSLLALDPTAELNPALSPKLRAPFERARQLGAAAPVKLQATVEGTVRQGQPLQLNLTLLDGPVPRITHYLIREEGTELRLPRLPGATQRVVAPAPPRAGAVTLEVRGLDAFEGRMVSDTLQLDAAPLRAPRSWALSWKVWGMGAGALALTGGVFGLYSRLETARASTLYYASDRAAGARLATNAAYAADGTWGLAVVAAVGTAILYLTERHEP